MTPCAGSLPKPHPIYFPGTSQPLGLPPGLPPIGALASGREMVSRRRALWEKGRRGAMTTHTAPGGGLLDTRTVDNQKPTSCY